MPDKIKEKFSVQIAYLEPEFIRIEGNAFYPAFITNLPRVDIKGYLEKLE